MSKKISPAVKKERERVIALFEEWIAFCNCPRNTKKFDICFKMLKQQIRSGKKPFLPEGFKR